MSGNTSKNARQVARLGSRNRRLDHGEHEFRPPKQCGGCRGSHRYESEWQDCMAAHAPPVPPPDEDGVWRFEP